MNQYEPDGDWMGNAIAAMMGVPSDYEDRKVERTEANGLIVSTCWTSDFGYETAILDKNGAHPVDRYETRDGAVEGHKEWVESAPKLDIIRKLGTMDGLVDDEFIQLERIWPTDGNRTN